MLFLWLKAKSYKFSKMKSISGTEKSVLIMKVPLGKLTLNAIGLHKMGTVHQYFLWNIFYLLSLKHKNKPNGPLPCYWARMEHSGLCCLTRHNFIKSRGSSIVFRNTEKWSLLWECLFKLREGSNMEKINKHRDIKENHQNITCNYVLVIFLLSSHSYF